TVWAAAAGRGHASLPGAREQSFRGGSNVIRPRVHGPPRAVLVKTASCALLSQHRRPRDQNSEAVSVPAYPAAVGLHRRLTPRSGIDTLRPPETDRLRRPLESPDALAGRLEVAPHAPALRHGWHGRLPLP